MIPSAAAGFGKSDKANAIKSGYRNLIFIVISNFTIIRRWVDIPDKRTIEIGKRFPVV